MPEEPRLPLPPPAWLPLHAAAQLALHHVLPGPRLVPPPWNRLALVVAALGVVLAAWSVRLFRRKDTPVRPMTESRALVLEGPYRFTRNPIYVGLVLLLAAGAVYLGTATPWLPVAAFAFLVHRNFVLREEDLLRARFGAAYEEYCRRVRRWI